MHYEYVYKSNRFESTRHKKTKKGIKGIVLLIGLIILGYYLSGFALQVFRNKNVVTVTSPLAEPVSAGIDTIKEVINPPGLEDVVRSSLANSPGIYGIVIKNLKTGETYTANKDRKFKSASLYKLWVLATSYQLLEKGKLDPDKILSSDVVDLNKRFDIATESAELTDGTVTARVQDALRQMVVISSNYAALLLVTEIKLSNVSKFLVSYEFSNSKTGSPPTTTASDIADFYEKLYAGKLADAASTKEMMDLLKDQQLNDRLPKYLPDGVLVAHKTGELDAFKHDAGIVFTPNGDYIVVVLSETNNPQAAAEKQALLSKAVYEYFRTHTE